MNRRVCAAALLAGCIARAAHADDTPPAAAPPGTAVSDVGRSIFVANEVDGISGDAPPRHIAVNDDIAFEEDITTGAEAKAIIEFRDGSTFEIGPDAAIRIDAFVFNPEESTSRKTIEVTRGVFRYVSAYVASEQMTRIATPAGNMGIRGSVAEGVVDPAVPDFLYLGEGTATFVNSAGSSAMQAGSSIAVPSAATPPMAPEAMPAPVAAQALQAIETRLPPRVALANRPAADDAWLKRAGAADLVPVAEQQRAQAASRAAARPPPAGAGTGALAGEFGLLVEANRVNLFAGRQTARTPEQTEFLARAARANPNAPATLRRFAVEAHAMHSAAVTAGTAFVIRGVGHAAPSAEIMRRVAAASVRANPGAAALIARHAGESYRGPDRGALGRPAKPAAERPAARPPAVHQPNAFERRQPPGGNAHAPPAQRPQLRRPAPQPPPRKAPPQKALPARKSPPKKGSEEDRNQR